ncbi:hypothetical protein [Streptomyces sp. NPDC058108]|uniref:hypothetical protein n=1 Tax=Streptomyces sp. NPDC058108 TaxID=3346344 RepID=UPI0036E99987
MRRTILIPTAALLLATACTSHTPDKPQADTHTASPAADGPGGASTQSSRLVVAIPAARLPYKPDPGMPALTDVRITKTATDPCAFPEDNSGTEAQLLGAKGVDSRTVNVTFSFSNPCSKPVAFTYRIASAIGSRKGIPAGDGAVGATGVVAPGQTIKEVIPVDVFSDLTPEQAKQLWVGCVEVGKAT